MKDVPDTVADLDASDHRRLATIRAWLLANCAEALGIPPESLDPSAPLSDYGLGSMQAVNLVGDLEEWLGRKLPATLLWDYPTLDAVASELTRPSDDDA
jgi:acyl carrier protein